MTTEAPIEQWKVIKNYPNYAISNLGRVRRETPGFNTEVGLIMKQTTNQNDYFIVGLRCSCCHHQKYFLVHRLVAEAFIPKTDTLRNVVNHKDGVKSNCCATNLEWVTHGENVRHAFVTGLNPMGDRNKCTKIFSKDIPLIRERVSGGETMVSVARSMGVSAATIRSALRKECVV